jgi:hypothetical protein
MPRVEEKSRSGSARPRLRDIANFISFSGFDKGPERFTSNLPPLFLRSTRESKRLVGLGETARIGKIGKTAGMSGRVAARRRKNRAPPPFGIEEKAYNIRINYERRSSRFPERRVGAERRAERRVKRRKVDKNERGEKSRVKGRGMDRTPYQENIVKRYYENKPDIMRQKLSELTTELYLAETPKKRAQLWKRVALAMKNLNLPEAQIEALIAKDDPTALAHFIERRLPKF